jgi:hypothetical protein
MLEDFTAYIRAISRHWGPLATGVGALFVTGWVEYIWPDHAPWWVWVAIIVPSVFIASFLAWREIERDKVACKKHLDFLNTPAVSLKLHHVDENFVGGDHQTIFIEVTGIGVDEVRPQVFALEVNPIGEDQGSIAAIGEPGPHRGFGLRRGETENVAIVTYDPKWLANRLRIDIPCKKITSKTYFPGASFRIKVCAYAGPKETELEFDFGLDDQTLWARDIGSSEKLVSNDRAAILRHIRGEQ